MTDPFAPLGDGSGSGRTEKPRRRCIMPVPPNAPTPPERHPKLGKPSATWTYRDSAGETLGYVHRFEEKGGGKSFRPLALFQNEDGQIAWRWESWPAPRPVYCLDRMAARPDSPVMICEGEKAADAIGALAPDYVGITSPGGSKGSGKADWSSLAERAVVIWPDADEPGGKYAETVVQLLREAGAKSVSVISPPDNVPPGFDARDALDDGWTEDRVSALISEAAGQEVMPETETKAGGGRKSPRQRDILLGVADAAELWHSPEKKAFATIPVNSHRENWPLESAAFKRWLAGQYYAETGAAAGGQQIADALRVLDMKAVAEGPCHEPLARTGAGKDAIWLDLVDNKWRAVKITADGWETVARPPVKFVRNEIMQALPDPEGGSLIEELRGFLNTDDGDFLLIVSWMVAALWGRGTQFPVMVLGGEQGSGKSTASRILRSLVDPSKVETSAPPRDERDLIVAAGASHVINFDNMSRIEPWLADAVCRLSTGAGFLTRKLHTDSDASWFQGSRPIILNGIPSLSDRADLAERSLTVRLLRIDEEGRKSEDEWWADWLAARPRVLGALLDALSGAMRRYDEIQLTKLPRMAAFAKLMAAASSSLGWEEGEFEGAYSANRSSTNEATFESDPVAIAIRDWITKERFGNAWEGTATELLVELNKVVGEDIKRSRFWPAKVNALGNAVDRAAPMLRQKGVNVVKKVTSSARMIIISLAE